MNDLIYRQDAIDLVDDLRDYISVDGYWAWIERMKSLPAAQPDLSEYSDNLWRKAYEQGKAAAQPKRIRGRWIKISPAGIYECSVCGQNVMTDDIDVYHYCHGCGADMRESR